MLGRGRLDPEGMDIAVHEVAQRLIDHSVPRYRALAAERFGNNVQLPVRAAARAMPGVAGMLLAFIAQIQHDRIQRLQLFADDLLARHHGLGESACAFFGGSGSSCTYFESHSACARMKRIMSPIPPNSLKFTQKLVEYVNAT